MVLAQSDMRRSNLASSPIARAFVLSLLFHATLFLTIEFGYQTGLWNTSFLFPKPQNRMDLQLARRADEAKRQQPPNEEVPLMFVDVDPSQAVTEAPSNPKYYSALNSQAANPDPKLNTTVPKIDGRQERVPQTMDRAKPAPQPLQPAPAPPQEIVEHKAEPEPAPEPAKTEPTIERKPGDLAMLKQTEQPKPAVEAKAAKAEERPKVPAPTAPPRPRTLAAARQMKGSIAGERVKQQGGVKRFSVEPSFDVRATPFGTYDAAIIAAIQKHWYDLLDGRDFPGTYTGKVVLEFRLNSDGSVTDLKVSETDVTEILALLCQRAVQDPAPFARWPADLRRLVGKEYRDVRFTFYYN
jgi:protein TonB